MRLRAALLFLCSVPWPARAPANAAPEDPLPLELRVPRMDSAEAQLAHARGLKLAMLERPEAERALWRRRALEAYQAVLHYHPERRELAAEAAFRAGELVRAAGGEVEALALFSAAQRLGEGTPYRARAGLEVGHLHRRQARPREALDAYLAVAGDPRAQPAHRDDAWLWAGKVWSSVGKAEEARRAWTGVASGGADPLDRVHAYDCLVLQRVEEGDLEAAAGVLDECLHGLAEVALEETERGARVRKALQRMRCVEALRDEVRRRVDGSAPERRGGEGGRAGAREADETGREEPPLDSSRAHNRTRNP